LYGCSIYYVNGREYRRGNQNGQSRETDNIWYILVNTVLQCLQSWFPW